MKFKEGDKVLFTNNEETEVLTLVKKYTAYLFGDHNGWSVKENDYFYDEVFLRHITPLDEEMK